MKTLFWIGGIVVGGYAMYKLFPGVKETVDRVVSGKLTEVKSKVTVYAPQNDPAFQATKDVGNLFLNLPFFNR